MTAPTAPVPDVSVVIATYNRAESAAALLAQLARQTLPADRYEVIVVDDGSAVPASALLAAPAQPYRLVTLRQDNAGPAAARHRGVLAARGDLIVVVDDDMQVEPTFLAEHLGAHPPGTRRVALGPLRPVAGEPMPLFERCHLFLLAKLEADVRAGRVRLRGTNLYTGNVSFRRADYLAVGGFDPAFRLSEDAELGVRLDAAGVAFCFADGAAARHASDHTSLDAWMRRSAAYGAADARVWRKHPTLGWASPWRFLFLMHPVTRLPLLAGALAPGLVRPLAWLAMRVALAMARLRSERVAIAGTTFVYGLQYFSGVHREAGSFRAACAGLAAYLRLGRAARRPGRAARREAAA